MKNKAACWILSILFVMAVIFPGLMMITGFRTGQGTAENRVLAELPEFSFSGITEYPKKFEPERKSGSR